MKNNGVLDSFKLKDDKDQLIKKNCILQLENLKTENLNDKRKTTIIQEENPAN